MAVEAGERLRGGTAGARTLALLAGLFFLGGAVRRVPKGAKDQTEYDDTPRPEIESFLPDTAFTCLNGGVYGITLPAPKLLKPKKGKKSTKLPKKSELFFYVTANPLPQFWPVQVYLDRTDVAKVFLLMPPNEGFGEKWHLMYRRWAKDDHQQAAEERFFELGTEHPCGPEGDLEKLAGKAADDTASSDSSSGGESDAARSDAGEEAVSGVEAVADGEAAESAAAASTQPIPVDAEESSVSARKAPAEDADATEVVAAAGEATEGAIAEGGRDDAAPATTAARQTGGVGGDPPPAAPAPAGSAPDAPAAAVVDGASGAGRAGGRPRQQPWEVRVAAVRRRSRHEIALEEGRRAHLAALAAASSSSSPSGAGHAERRQEGEGWLRRAGKAIWAWMHA